ncbi:Protein of unknown function [Gryllus bimaculatus]|nr:Protein of unknown function [Gryllus bimaculatus]
MDVIGEDQALQAVLGSYSDFFMLPLGKSQAFDLIFENDSHDFGTQAECQNPLSSHPQAFDLYEVYKSMYARWVGQKTGRCSRYACPKGYHSSLQQEEIVACSETVTEIRRQLHREWQLTNPKPNSAQV